MKRVIFGIILFFGCCFVVNDYGEYNYIREKIFDGVFGKYKDNYFLVLRIPKISLERVVYEIGNELNDVDLNVELLEDSDISKNIFFLAGHSGRGDNCYFNDLVLLEVGDVIEISLFDRELLYEVRDIYYIDKVGYMDVSVKDNSLYLVTCSLIYLDKQLVVKGSLILE